jgi:hypothetical protein
MHPNTAFIAGTPDIDDTEGASDRNAEQDWARWIEENADDPAWAPAIALDKRTRRRVQAAERLGRGPMGHWTLNDVDMARAAVLPPVVARRTTPRTRGAGRPAGRPATHAPSRSGSGDDDGSGSSGGDDPHLANAARTLRAILAQKHPGTTWSVTW